MRAGLDAHGRHDVGWLSTLEGACYMSEGWRARSKLPPSRPLGGAYLGAWSLSVVAATGAIFFALCVPGIARESANSAGISPQLCDLSRSWHESSSVGVPFALKCSI